MRQKRLQQSHLASCPREPLNGLRIVVEPWCYPETPGSDTDTASLLVTQKRRDEHMFVIIKVIFPWDSEQWSPWWCYVKEKVLYLRDLPLFKWLLPLPRVSFGILWAILRISSSSWTNGKWAWSPSSSPSPFLPQFLALSISPSPSLLPPNPPCWRI